MDFAPVDVLTDCPSAGNPLAVVRDAAGLPKGTMQRVAPGGGALHA